jgi:hypothetical protein
MILLGIGSRVRHPDFGDGVVITLKATGYIITFMAEGVRTVSFQTPLDVIEAVEPDGDLVSLLDVEQALSRVLQRWADVTELVPLGDKWKGGKLILKPGRPDLAPKEMPVDAFFHKIVMIRDRLRTLEQRVNASRLDDEEKLNIQQYITRIYGSLTSFNLFFKHSEHAFTGDRATAEV